MRTAVVTGAAQGIGHAVAKRLFQGGCNVLLADLDLGSAQAAGEAMDPSGERALAVALDVRREHDFACALEIATERFGAVDVLVNNAALTSPTPIWEIQEDEWDDVLAVNLRGTFYGCRVVGAHMRARGSGRIVNLASLAGQWGRSLTGAHYVASKAGIIGLTRLFAQQLAAHGVTVNAVAPAAIDGPQVRAMPAGTIESYVSSSVPVARLGQPDEVAELVAYLASDASGYVTGATIDINGGALMR